MVRVGGAQPGEHQACVTFQASCLGACDPDLGLTCHCPVSTSLRAAAATRTRHTWTRTFRFPQFPWRPGAARRRSRAPRYTLRLALAARRPEWQGTALPLSRPIGAALPLALPNSAIGSGTCASARPGMHWHFQTRQGSGAGALHRDRPPADRLRPHPSRSRSAPTQGPARRHAA